MIIEICDRCKGFGILDIDVGSHNSEREQETCNKCGGSGRLEITTSTKTRPFAADTSRRYHREAK